MGSKVQERRKLCRDWSGGFGVIRYGVVGEVAEAGLRAFEMIWAVVCMWPASQKALNVAASIPYRSNSAQCCMVSQRPCQYLTRFMLVLPRQMSSVWVYTNGMVQAWNYVVNHGYGRFQR